MGRPALRLKVSKKDQTALKKLLGGGVEQVRVTLRAVALQRLGEGMSAPQIAAVLPLTRQSVRNLARRYQQGGLERALYDKQRPGAASLLFGPTTSAHHRHGLQRPAQGPRPLDGATGRRRSRQATTGPSGGPRNDSCFAPQPRPQAVAGKKCGAWRSSMKPTSPAWKTCWKRTNGPTIRRSR